MKKGKLVLIFITILISIPVWGNSTPIRIVKEEGEKPTTIAKSPESPEDKAYREAMIKISNAIDQKISQIEAKQREIEGELYPAYRPPLQAELGDLQKQLKELELQRNQLQTQKTSRDMKKELEKAR